MENKENLLKIIDEITNSLNPADYLFSFNQINQIIRYVNDHREKYANYNVNFTNIAVGSTDMQPFKDFINQIKGNLVIASEIENFYKSIKNFESPISRINVIRLCFALELNFQEASNFLMSYMHESELSARSLIEFLAICALNSSDMTWKDVYELTAEFVSILDMPASPNNPGTGMTQEVVTQVIPTLTSVEAIRDYLDPLKYPEHVDFFARTRNTQYLALFDDVRIDFDHNRAELAEQKHKSNPLSVKGYYTRLFGIQSLDGDITDNYLTKDDIKKLIRIYPDVFMTDQVFSELVNRTRNEPIASGMFLLHLLVTMESSDHDKRHGIDFTKTEKVIDYINSTMLETGYPFLSEKNLFDKLVIDVINSTCNKEVSSENSRRIILETLRHILKKL